MIKIAICGAGGKMGRKIAQLAKNHDNMTVIAGIDLFADQMNASEFSFSLVKTPNDLSEKPDVIIDFSNPSSLDALLAYSKEQAVPVVLSTTGYSAEQIEQIKEASKETALFFSWNMSLGINLLVALAQKAASILGDKFDVEIVEKHHNLKLDAPSGTALMLANAVNEVYDNAYEYTYERHSKRERRPKNEIGIHSIRGGTIVGEHDVIFAGQDEVITLSHSAASKDVFAEGSLKAAEFLVDKTSGLYDMKSVL